MNQVILEHNGQLFVLSKSQLARSGSRQMTQIKKKKWQDRSAKKDSSVRHFSYQLTREISKTKGKNSDKTCQLVCLKIYPQQQKQ